MMSWIVKDKQAFTLRSPEYHSPNPVGNFCTVFKLPVVVISLGFWVQNNHIFSYILTVIYEFFHFSVRKPRPNKLVINCLVLFRVEEVR